MILIVKYNSLAELSDLLFRRIEEKSVTLEMTQSSYDNFIDALDSETNIYVRKFRPIKINEDDETEICQWLFNGILKFKIKIK